MEKIKLNKLKKLSKGLSILYVENNPFYQKSLYRLLNSLFDECYQAYDGLEGLRKFKKHKPDIVLTDLSLVLKSAFEMIVDIKQLDENVKIMTLSEPCEDYDILQSIDMGISKFLMKPLNTNKIIDSLLSLVLQIDKQKYNNGCLDEISQLKQSNKTNRFINSFKGIPMVYEKNIFSIKDEEVLLKIPLVQSVSMRYEKKTVLEIQKGKKYIELLVNRYDKKNELISLIKPNYVEFDKRFDEKRVQVDDEYKGILHYKKSKLDIKVIDLTSAHITFLVEKNKNLNIKKSENIELGLVFELHKFTPFSKDLKTARAYCKGVVKSIENMGKHIKVYASISVKKSDQSTFSKYLIQRENDILNEFKKLIKKNI